MLRLLFLGLCFVTPAFGAPAQGTQAGVEAPSSPSARGSEGPILFGDSPPYEYPAPFFPGIEFDPAISPPERLLGQPVGSRLAHHDEIVAAFRQWALESDKLDLAVYGTTHEGRELVRAVVSSAENVRRMAQIRGSIAQLADPRGLDPARASELLESTPAVAWMGYSIHGDETSGTDAALAVAYRLIAGEDADIARLLDQVVVVIDPCLNPDGRMRTVTQVEQNAGYVTNLDAFSRHRGHWPYGRGNHYLFDMNRDWMTGVCPETRGRWRVARELPPQLFVDAHEMAGFDTYLFYPQSKPLNPELPTTLPAWQARMAQEHARAFDELGWGYYTREWADAWYPGYSDAWGSLNGAIGLLYEQGSVSGQPLRRESGQVVSYRESVRGHVVSSLANLSTLASHRRAVLSDYLAFRRSAVDPQRAGARRAFVVVPGRVPDREADFLELLLAQGIEVYVATEPFAAQDVESSLLERSAQHDFPEGAYLVPVLQPQAALVCSYLNFDPRMDEESLLVERTSLERKRESKIYDVTAWDLGRAFDLDAYWCDLRADRAAGDFTLLTAAPPAPGGSTAPLAEPPYAFVVDGRSDASLRFAAAALQLDLAVHVSDKAFTTAGESFPRGSLLVRRHENGVDFEQRVARASASAGVVAVATGSGRSTDEGPDLGGGHFHLLERPRVAVVAGPPVNSDDYGHVWHMLDVQLGVPFSILEAHALGSYDLRRYNVLILPPGNLGGVLAEVAEELSVWVQSGGVLIACGSAAAALAGADADLSSVVLRRNALEELDAYEFAMQTEQAARSVRVDFDALWGTAAGADSAPDPARDPARDPALELARELAEDPGPDGERPSSGEGQAGDQAGAKPGALERRDAWARRFAPAGAILRAHVDVEHWLTVGAGLELPVAFRGAEVFLSRAPVETPVRFADSARIRLGGLLWPEARERLARSAWSTCERRGRGAVILFASAPAFRGFSRGTARLLGNAIVFGPGLGASPPREW